VYNTGPEPPSAGQARMNSGFPWGATTKLWVRFVSADDQDVYWGIMLVEAGSTILLQDKDSHASYVLFEVTAKPVDKGLYAEIAVIHRSNGNSINTAAPIILQRNPSTALLIEGLEALTRRVEALEKGKPKP
jgi:hypothetical protein